MIAGNVLASEFPEGSVKISDVDYVAGGVANLDTVADLKRPADEDVNPGDKAFQRGLHGQADDDGADAQSGDDGVPIHEDHRHSDGGEKQPGDEIKDPL